MPQPWTTPQQVVVRWLPRGTAPSPNDTSLPIFIQDAEDEILRHFPRIQERITSGSLPISRVQAITAKMINRAWVIGNAPVVNESQAQGPASRSIGFTGDSRGLYLTTEEKAQLAPSDNTTTSVFMTNAIGRASLSNGDRLWYPVSDHGGIKNTIDYLNSRTPWS